MVEHGVWLDEEGGVWLDTEHACDVKVCILPPHEQGKNPAPTPSAVYAPSRLLCTIPYFQACLSEPWQENTPSSSFPHRQITLECVDPSSPSDYRNCLLFLAPQEPVQMSVDVGIRLLRAADHLLYQECADDCMAYLASAPWSDKEEEAIDDAISSMGLKPSSDLAARLTSADDMKVFKEVITHLTEKVGCGEMGVAALHDFVNATFNEAPAQATCVCMSVIREAWTTATKNLITGSHLRSVSLWNTLTILALEYGDAKSFLADFIGRSKKLCGAMTRIRDRFSVAEVLIQVFLRVIPGKANNKLVLLSNSQRLALLAAWAPMVADLKCESLESAFRQLFTTLPLQDPVLIALVKEETTNPHFGDCYAWWRTKLFERMKRCNSAREEIDLEASNSSKERVKLVSGEES